MAGTPSYVVDWDRITDALEMACQIRGLTLRDAAEAIGVPPSSLTRLRQGKHLSADALAALAAWLFPKDVPFWFKAVDQ